MDIIALHIEFLLRRHDCVIVPGIGAFIATRRAAVVNEEWGFITPPQRDIHFNAAINHNDGLLAHSISRKNRIPYESAVCLMNEEIAALKSALDTDREAAIGRLGILLKGEEECLQFRPMKNQADRWLRSVPFPASSANEKQAEAETVKAERRKPGYYYIPVIKRFARVAAIFAVILLGLISLSLPPASAPGSNLASVVPMKVEKQAAAPAPADTLPSIAAPEPEPLPAAVSEDSYYLIVASLATEREAEKFIASHSTSSYELKICSTASMSRVYAASSTDKTELSAELNSVRFQNEFPEGWIWKKK